jgi:sulfoxide reductase catalytic subunit YedY
MGDVRPVDRLCPQGPRRSGRPATARRSSCGSRRSCGPTEARHQLDTTYPWPYQEGLTLAEATNELAFIATGIYGAPLPKQNGAPVRLVVPWKYGFKSIKSIVKIEFTDQQPSTFWNTLNPHEYSFEANVDPAVPHPRWSQQYEWMLGSRANFDTVKYNGYGDWVAKLYEPG